MRSLFLGIILLSAALVGSAISVLVGGSKFVGIVLASESNRTHNVSHLFLNKKKFSVGERMLLRFNSASEITGGPWDVYLSVIMHVDKVANKKAADRKFLPQWSATKSPAKKNVILRQGVMDIIDIVVEKNLPVGHHQLELHLLRSGQSKKPITFQTEFDILPSATSDLEVIVDMSAAGRQVKSLTGFLHGLSSKKHKKQLPDTELQALIQSVRPSFWRLNNNYVYRVAKENKAAVTFVFGDLLAQEGIKPWKFKNGHKLENALREKLRWLRAADIQPEYLDLWNEPDTKQSWDGSVEQFFDYVRLAVPIIREEYPNVKIVAPSTADNYLRIPDFWGRFISFVRENEIHLDALSWHEFHRPEDIPQTAAKIRDEIKEIHWLKDVELHVNEYGGGQNHLIPGWQLGWLYYLDSADLDWTNHACWYWPRGNGKENVSECVRGLNGLLHPLTLEPLPAYWVNFWQGQMSGNRLFIETPTPRIVALGSYSQETGKGQILLGRFSCGVSLKWCRFHGSQIQDEFLPGEPLTVVFKNFPASDARIHVSIAKVTGDRNQEPLLFPEMVAKKVLQFENGTASLQLDLFRDGDVYNVAISKEPLL